MSAAVFNMVRDEIAPEFASISDGLMAARLVWARRQVDVSIFDADEYTVALAYLVAHRLTKDLAKSGGVAGGGGGASGPAAPVGALTSATTGPLSEGYEGSGSSGYAAKTASDADLMTTTYGQAWLSMRDTSEAVAPVTLN